VPFGWLAWRYGDRDRAMLYSAAFVAPLVLAMTRELFPQNDHFLQMWPVFALPLVIMGLAEAHQLLDPQVRRIAYAALAGAAVVGVVYPLVYQGRALRELDEGFSISVAERNAYRWLETNADDDATVVSPSRSTNYLLAGYTQTYGYLADGIFTRVSDDELIDRYLRAQAAFGYGEEETFDRIDPVHGAFSDTPRPADLGPEEHTERSMADFLLGEQFIEPDRINDRIPEWRERFRTYQRQADVLSAYDADYLLCDHRTRFWASPAAAPGTYVVPVFQQDGVIVYELVDANTKGSRAFGGCQYKPQ
jgi:hypothetical protein